MQHFGNHIFFEHTQLPHLFLTRKNQYQNQAWRHDLDLKNVQMHGNRFYHLKQTLKKHFEKTGSLKAKEIYEEFDRYEPYFWLVSPAAANIQDLLKATTANAA